MARNTGTKPFDLGAAMQIQRSKRWGPGPGETRFVVSGQHLLNQFGKPIITGPKTVLSGQHLIDPYSSKAARTDAALALLPPGAKVIHADADVDQKGFFGQRAMVTGPNIVLSGQHLLDPLRRSDQDLRFHSIFTGSAMVTGPNIETALTGAHLIDPPSSAKSEWLNVASWYAFFIKQAVLRLFGK
jgi:hypothetical protein